MRKLKTVVLDYTKRHPESFAGRWIDREGEGPTLVVAFTSDLAHHQERLPSDVRVVERQHSLRELETAVLAVESSEDDLEFETVECSIDVERNQIELVAHAGDPEGLQTQLEARWPGLVYLSPADPH